MKKEIKILVLGSSGMLGKEVFENLLSEYPNTIGTVRLNPNKNQIKFTYRSKKELNNLFKNETYNFVINCIGILKNSNSNYKINYLLPQHLSVFSEKYNFKIIHISTDDVYGDLSGEITENSITKPNNLYAKSKLKGEISSKKIINIRTSIIGKDSEGKGLIEWVIKNKNNTIKGYINQNWSGCTTYQFAMLCKYLIKNDNFRKINAKSSTVLFFPLGPISKYDLLKKISKKFKINLTLEKEIADHEINRNFKSLFFDKKFLQSYTTEIHKALSKIND